MLARTRTALRARRDILNQDRGFSLVELMIVVVVIGILASIGIPIYFTLEVSARDASVKSDLVQAKIVMVSQFTKSGSYPANYAALTAAGFAPGTTTQDGYLVNFVVSNVSANGFCIRAWADTDAAIRDLWVSSSSAVVGPIPVSDVANRPPGC